MKRLITLVLMLCVVMTVPAMAVVGETLELNEDLMGFRNELTGEVVRLGMTMEEVGEIAGVAYYSDAVRYYRNWAFYEGGLIVYYRHAEEPTAVAMTVIPNLIDAECLFYIESLEDVIDDEESGYGARIYESGTHSAAVRTDTEAMISVEMLREEVEAITGAPIRETYIDHEYAYMDEYNERISYATTDKILSWENDKLVTIDVPGITKVDYDGISVGYRAVEQDGVTYYIVADDCFVDSGRWYQLANGIAMGDSAEAVKAHLGEYASVYEGDDGIDLDAFVHFTEDGAKLITKEDAYELPQSFGPDLEKQSEVFYLSFHVSEDGEISMIKIGDGMFAFRNR